ncbi:MAG TPA: LemA family protein [Candidatus Hydrogenedentes bacterium]|nr:LemA family protein [Candidatus Hydrogenedentota bacterium]
MIIVLLVLVGLAVLLVLWLIGVYNVLIRLRNEVRNAWSQIDVQLKRRHDLIPNLVETAKGYMQHERETLESVTRARNLAAGASGRGVGEQGKAEAGLSQALSSFFVVVEQYPDLKANQNFLALQEELTSTENKISFARQAYNDQAMHLNNKIEMFPSNIVAGMFRFERAEFFEIEAPAEREVPKVSFS